MEACRQNARSPLLYLITLHRVFFRQQNHQKNRKRLAVSRRGGAQVASRRKAEAKGKSRPARKVSKKDCHPAADEVAILLFHILPLQGVSVASVPRWLVSPNVSTGLPESCAPRDGYSLTESRDPARQP